MKDTGTGRAITAAATVLVVLIGVGLLGAWLSIGPTVDVRLSVTQMDDPTGQEARDAEDRAKRLIEFEDVNVHDTFAGEPADLPGEWARFRGPSFDAIVTEDVQLAHSFPAEGPRKIWELGVGLGYSGPVVHKGRVFLQDYDDSYKNELFRCFSLTDGKEIWRTGYRIEIDNNHGQTRTVPAVTDKYAVMFGSYCVLMCVETDTGKPKWVIDFSSREGDYACKIPMWHAGQCPLIDDGKVIAAPASKNALMVGVDCETGEVEWTTPNTPGWKQSHSSILPMTVAGTKMYVYAAVGGVVGVAAEGERAGELLWSVPDCLTGVVMPMPVPVSEDRVFVTSGYSGGCALIKIEGDGSKFSAGTVYNYRKTTANDCFSCYQQTPIFHEGRLFGIQSNEAKERAMEFVCADPSKPGAKIVWGSGQEVVLTAKKKKNAWGPWILADGKFYVFADSGMMAIFEANTEECALLGTTQLWEHGHETWGPPAIAGGLLLMRDISRLACFDIRK